MIGTDKSTGRLFPNISSRGVWAGVLFLLFFLGFLVTLQIIGNLGVPVLVFSGYTNSPSEKARFTSLPETTRWALFCVSNASPNNIRIDGDVYWEKKTDRIPSLRHGFPDYVEQVILHPSESLWFAFPEPNGVTDFQVSVPHAIFRASWYYPLRHFTGIWMPNHNLGRFAEHYLEKWGHGKARSKSIYPRVDEDHKVAAPY